MLSKIDKWKEIRTLFNKPLTEVILFFMSWICLFCYFAVLSIAIFLPIYTDEILWKLFGSRLFIDKGQLVYSFPQCSSGFMENPPLTWWPAKIYDSVIYMDMTDPTKHRAAGVLGFLMFFALATWLLRKFSRDSVVVSSASVLSIVSIGTLPFLMVFNRPEQFLLLSLLLCSIVPIFLKGGTGRTFIFDLSCTLIALGFSFFIISTHPKGLVFLLPLFYSYWLITGSKWRNVLSLILLLGVSFSIFETNNFWNLRTNCTDSPWLTKILSDLTLKPALLFSNPKEFFKLGITNLLNFNSYIENTQFKTAYQGDWLPGAHFTISKLEKNLNNLLYLPALICFIFVGLQFVRIFLKRRLEKRMVGFALITLAVSVGIMFIQTNRNFYESGLIIPLTLILFIFSVGAVPLGNRSRKLYQAFLVITIFSSILQLGNLFYSFFPLAINDWRLRPKNLSLMQEKVDHLTYNLCGFDRDEPLKNLVVDEITYTILWRSYGPMFVHSVFGWWGTGTDYRETLHKRHATGIIAICDPLPPEVVSEAIRFDIFCCVKNPELKSFMKKQLVDSEKDKN